ncbi:DUF4245 family protein [Nocardioides sp. Root151]|uniref:DUF4245 family protein n=1 Tax=Nocardioides sp. Root151 TaxID=1736475 RepID=UPI0007038C57|nr:DUF4245 family protein [Nocardioides sp. Root151]KQZ75135.1 hypothetical protein ASD66_01825 [Nocardioides sp. Root151]
MSQQRGGSHYSGSSIGMVGAMIVTVGVILIFVIFRSVTRDDLDVEREAIDYLPAVQGLQKSVDFDLAYPPRLPEGAKAVDVEGALGAGWSLDILTHDDEFIGVYQGAAPVEDFLKEYVDDDAVDKGDPVTLKSAIAPTWQSWKDEDGDYALTAEHDGTVVLVFGTADHGTIQQVAESLVTEPVT